MKVVKENPLLVGERGQTTLRMAQALIDRIDQIAEENGTTRSDLVERILAQALTDSKFVLKL